MSDMEAWLRQLQWPLALIVDGKSVANLKARCVPWPNNSLAPMFVSGSCNIYACALLHALIIWELSRFLCHAGSRMSSSSARPGLRPRTWRTASSVRAQALCS